MKKTTKDNLRHVVAGLLIALLVLAGTFEVGRKVSAQNTNGYHFGPGGSIIFTGQNAGVCFEGVYLAGPDSCLFRLQNGTIGFANGAINSGAATMANAPVIALATATTGGTIPDGTSYRLALTYVTPTGGQTTITSAQEATQTTSGGGLSTITATAPIAQAGAAGYAVYSTNASGVGNSNTTLTELSQPITTAVCAGAFQVNGPLGPGTGQWVCPFGTNAVFTSLVFTAATATTPNIPGSGPTVINGGLPIPAVNSAVYPAGIPETICNNIALTAITTSTTIKTIATCNLSAGLQNSFGKLLHITGHGVYTATGTPTFAVSLVEGGVTPIIITSAAVTTGGQTNAQFSFDLYLTTGLTGTAGKVEAHGTLTLQGATAANTTAMILYEDTNTALSSALDLTAANALTIGITGSSGVSATTLRDSQIVLMN